MPTLLRSIRGTFWNTHNTYEDIFKYLANVKASGATYFIGSNDYGVKENPRYGDEKFQSGGYRPLNYNLPPFNFPKSILEWTETPPEIQGSLTHCIWKVADLPTEAKY
jgi:hypothetical protein